MDADGREQCGGASQGVFINYRGDDSHSYGALLYASLSKEFGADLVFLDAESISAGSDYVEQLVTRVRHAQVVLAVIGAQWLTVTGASGLRRIDDPADWIHRELSEAFAAGVRVIPVLTDSAEMPTETQLPSDLAALARCQFRRLRHRDATADLARLVDDLTRASAVLATARRVGPYPLREIVCPYPGMVSFGREEAPYFCGREKLLASVLARRPGNRGLAQLAPTLLAARI